MNNLTLHQFREAPVRCFFILGGGDTLQQDLDFICQLPSSTLRQSGLMALNRTSIPRHYADMLQMPAHHVTYHADELHNSLYCLQYARRHATTCGEYTTDVWTIPEWFAVGGSAFLAAMIARQLGAEWAVLAGCPMHQQEGNYPTLLQQVVDAPMLVRLYFRSFVRSLSGATQSMFGGFTALPNA